MNLTCPRVLLALIILLYVLLATLFAVFTPPWQAPDEPAHYNYVGYVAAHAAFPVLQMGDYPHTYLEEIKRRGFPPDLSIAAIRYEFHQPPLYYLLAAPIFNLTGGDLLALRLFSVALGVGIVLLAYTIGRRVLPDRPALALGTAAFVAFLPQHLATVSQVGNDVLAELLFAMTLFVMIGELRETAGNCGELGAAKGSTYHESRITNHAPRITHHAVRLSLLLGFILITKTTAYIAVPLAAGVIAWRWRQERAGLRRILAEGVALILPAAVIALPWYARGVVVYGWPDFLGLIRHDAIVIGQTRTAEFIAQMGWGAYWQRAIEFTFKSFWGVFGWLGIFMDSRVYFGLAVWSGVALGGLGIRVACCVVLYLPAKQNTRTTHHAPRTTQYALLTLSTLLTFLVYAWYNTQFVQHQGRYLFTALIPLALMFAAGWRAAIRPGNSRWLAAALVGFGVGLAAWGELTGHGLPRWPLVITVVFAAVLAAADFRQRLLQGKGTRINPLSVLRKHPERSPAVVGQDEVEGCGHYAKTAPLPSTPPAKASGLRSGCSAMARRQGQISDSYFKSCGTQHTISSTLFALPFIILPLLALYALFGAIVPQLGR